MWIEEYPLTFNPNKVDFEKVYITKEAYNKLKDKLKK